MNPNTEPLLLTHRDARGAVTLTLNRPAAFNALSEALLDALQTELDHLAKDETVRVVVLAGAGKAFCAGHDLKEMRAEPALDYYQALFKQCGRVMMAIQKLPVPVIARVQGIATAAGCQLVAMCDLAVAASTARFAVSGVNLGLFCATPSVALSRNLGRKAAFEMLVTGEFISAEQALLRSSKPARPGHGGKLRPPQPQHPDAAPGGERRLLPVCAILLPALPPGSPVALLTPSSIASFN